MDDELAELSDLDRAYGDLLVATQPLPPGLDWDYFAPLTYNLSDDVAELGDTENPAVDDVFDWGMPLIGCPCEDW